MSWASSGFVSRKSSLPSLHVRLNRRVDDAAEQDLNAQDHE
jgi:hypothetical protein